MSGDERIDELLRVCRTVGGCRQVLEMERSQELSEAEWDYVRSTACLRIATYEFFELMTTSQDREVTQRSAHCLAFLSGKAVERDGAWHIELPSKSPWSP